MELRRMVWPGSFSLEIPEQWTSSEEEGVVSCYDPENGVGVVQVSLFAWTPSGAVTRRQAQDVTLRFLANRSWSLSEDDISQSEAASGIITEFEYEDIEQGSYWRVVHVFSSTRMALLTYTCALKDVSVEGELVGHLLSSFAWEQRLS